MEEIGIGVETFKTKKDKYKLPLPSIMFENSNFVVTFTRNSDGVRESGENDFISKLNDEELEGYDYVKVQESVSKNEYAKHFNYSDKKAQRHLTKLKDLGFVVLEGKGRASVYKIIYNQ